MATVCPLSAVAEIFPGISIAGKIAHEVDGPFHLILPRHVSDDGEAIRYSAIASEDHVRMAIPRVAPARILRPGDIVFMARGERNRAALIIELPADGPAIAPGVFLVIRPDPARVVPAYLSWVLNQAPMQDLIRRQVRTASVTTPMVPRDAFAALPLELPPLARQQQIAELGNLLRQELRLQQRLHTLTTLRHQLIARQLLATPTPASSSSVS